jgi:hypothetical protein
MSTFSPFPLAGTPTSTPPPPPGFPFLRSFLADMSTHTQWLHVSLSVYLIYALSWRYYKKCSIFLGPSFCLLPTWGMHEAGMFFFSKFSLGTRQRIFFILLASKMLVASCFARTVPFSLFPAFFFLQSPTFEATCPLPLLYVVVVEITF